MQHTNTEHALLIDFGSTYTKLVAVDLSQKRIAGQAQALTTVESGINLGLRNGLDQLEAEYGLKTDQFTHRLACSSAAGGLRVVAIGLVKNLTVEAARQAALGAGARLTGAYGDRLTANEIEEIVEARPDMILLAGGIDGGDRDTLQYNAGLLANAPIEAPFVIAGNKEAMPPAAAALQQAGKEVRATENVLPRLQEINVEPAREIMRRLFMERIVHAKGLDQAEKFVGRVIMPTPAAILHAVRLLAEGAGAQPGWDSVMVIDIGGATTDVHSVARDPSPDKAVIRHGLPEPYAKRTVEGDLGLRVSALALLETVALERLSHEMGPETGQNERLQEAVRQRAQDIGFVAQDEYNTRLDDAMARLCADIGSERHVGRLREHYLPTGFCYIQDGKDLTQVRHLIGTGGIFRYSEQADYILSGALFDERRPFDLKPTAPQLHIDRQYILWAMGLLAQHQPETALEIMQGALSE